MPGSPHLSDNQTLLGLAAAFLSAADDAAVRTPGQMTSALEQGMGWSGHSGATFIRTTAVVGAQSALVEPVLRKLGTRRGHEDEVRSACWRRAALWLTAEDILPVAAAARQLLVDLETANEVTADLILPNYTFKRAAGVESVHIGPVEILDAELAKRRVDAFDNEHVRFVIDGGRGLAFRDAAFDVSYPDTCWWVRVAAAPKNVRDEGAWLIDVAISLTRFLHRPWRGLPPGIKDREPAACEPSPRDQSGMFFIGDAVNAGGFSAPRYYELDEAAAQAIGSDGAKVIATAVFSPVRNSVGERVAQGLGWLTRARRAGDRSEAFLFYFTALEALLSSGKGEPVSQTIARQIAVMRNNKPASRIKTFDLVRKLYEVRSRLVHTGDRSALALDVRTMNALTDIVFWRVVRETDLSVPAAELIASLNRATFGEPWAPPMANRPSPDPDE